jgi:GNAT superfamily N-acetyltransferase
MGATGMASARAVPTIREATPEDAPGIATVHVESWRTTYRELLPADFLADLSVERRAAYWAEFLRRPDRDSSMLVAEEAGRIVGFVVAGPERTGTPNYRGEVYAIYLLESHQRRGIGAALLRAAVAWLRSSGYNSMLIWVLAGNPSRGFYAAMGGQPVATQPITIGDTTLEEVAYGWSDLAAFAPGQPGSQAGG